MSAVWDKSGNRTGVTILQIPQAQVIQVKTLKKHGYWANQIGIGWRHPRNINKAMLGHFAAAKVPPKAKVSEFRVRDESGLLPMGLFSQQISCILTL
jgi:large subunit ribosomal protein L3